MTFKKMIMSIAVLAALASGVVQAAEANWGRERRWDFDCHFADGYSCDALATVYTRRDLTEDARAEAPDSRWGYLNRLAVQCERGGLIYANSANLSFHNDHMVISTSSGTRPRLVMDLPLGQVRSTAESGSTSAMLLLPNGDEISGSCEYRSHGVHD